MARVVEIAEHFPRLRAHGKDWADGDPTDDLAFGLRAILDGLQAQLQ